MICGHPVEHGWSSRDYIFKKKKRHSYNLPIVNSSSVRSGTSCSPLLSILRFGLALAWMGIVHTVINPVALYVQLPCHAQKILFPCRQLPPLTLAIFLCPKTISVSQWSLNLGRVGCDIHFSFGIEHSLVSCSLYLNQLRISVFLIISRKMNLLWWELRDALLYVQNDSQY